MARRFAAMALHARKQAMSETIDSKNREPRIVVLYCQHSVGDDVDVTSCVKKVEGVRVRAAMMPCSSKVQASHLLNILDQEADGVEVITCPVERCEFLVGSKRSTRRVEYARRLLDEIGVGPDRLGVSHGAALSEEEFVKRVAARAEAVMKLEKIGEDL